MKGFFGDKMDAAFWRSLASRKDMLFKIKDTQAYEDAMKAGKSIATLEDKTVSWVQRYTHREANADWIFFTMPGKQPLVLMVRAVNEAADAYILFTHDESGVPVIQSGSRQDLLDGGQFFLFSAPKDENDFVPAELDWTPDFTMDDAEGSGEPAVFAQEAMGTQYATLKTVPFDKVFNGILCGITEYHTDKKLDNPHFIVIEDGIDWNPTYPVGLRGKREGGLCTIYAGCAIPMSDIEVSLP